MTDPSPKINWDQLVTEKERLYPQADGALTLANPHLLPIRKNMTDPSPTKMTKSEIIIRLLQERFDREIRTTSEILNARFEASEAVREVDQLRRRLAEANDKIRDQAGLISVARRVMPDFDLRVGVASGAVKDLRPDENSKLTVEPKENQGDQMNFDDA